MLIIKNFSVAVPTEEQLLPFEGSLLSPRFLRSDDDQDWYECQKQFSADKIKIMFDAQNVIRSVVDKPVIERGNKLDISMFYPEGMSVAEIDGDLPEGFSIDGSWIFDGENIVRYEQTIEELIASAETEKQQRLGEAASTIAPLQDAVDLGIATEDETAQLLAWKQYRVLLSRVDTSTAPDITWPTLN